MVRPYHPLRELEAHLDRGELDSAVALARGLANERRRPLELDVTLRFLPLVAAQRPDAFDTWALRWLERWCAERRDRATIEDAGELATALAEVAVDPERALLTISALQERVAGAAKSRASRR